MDHTRIAELRRRLLQDPASIAFAQLAEEYRRAGEPQQAITYCRAGLVRHPGYLSARVTLGRALIEVGEIDEAARELAVVLDAAPDNLSAIQAMADVYERRGALTDALSYYKRALTLARFDPRIEARVTRIDRELSSTNDASALHEPFRPARSLMDFDALLTSLGAPGAAPPPLVDHLLADDASPIAFPRETAYTPTRRDPLEQLEEELRAFSRERDASPDEVILETLEGWLRAIRAERSSMRGSA